MGERSTRAHTHADTQIAMAERGGNVKIHEKKFFSREPSAVRSRAPVFLLRYAPRRNDVSPTGRSNINGCRDLGAGIRKVGVAAATTSSPAYFLRSRCGGKASGNIISRDRPRRRDDKSDDESATFSCRRQWFTFARHSPSLSLSLSLSPTFHGRLSSTSTASSDTGSNPLPRRPTRQTRIRARSWIR